MMQFRFFPPLVLLLHSLGVAQDATPAGGGAAASPGPVPREVRAVWVTTVAGLDWPGDTPADAQRDSLSAIVERLHRSGFNTLFFQVRGRGDAFYRPGLEPWSAALTGRAGADPGWDPLQFLLDQAHRRGMEVHAWFNTYFVKGGQGPPSRTNPPHVMTGHPEWVVFHEDRWWLDPGKPGVERYLLDVASDIVRRYDLDGIQFDYLRYPGRNFDDRKTYERHGRGAEREEWRRGNVTRFLERASALLRSVRPGMKIGVTPIGIYTNPPGIHGMESYADVYQDTRLWIRQRLVDYVAPQLYWPIGGGNGDPDFAALAVQWRVFAEGVQLYVGIGSYKPEVMAQTSRQVGIARAAGADGQAYFRYASIAGSLPFDFYGSPAFPPPMVWKDSVVPSPPSGLVAGTGDAPDPPAAGSRPPVRLRWSRPPDDEPGGFYAVYRLGPGVRSLAAIVPADSLGFTDTAAAGSPESASYAVTRLDRAWNESAPAGWGPGAGPELTIRTEDAGRSGDRRVSSGSGPPGAPGRGSAELRLGRPRAGRSGNILFLPVRIGSASSVSVALSGDSGEDVVLYSGLKGAGAHVLTLDVSALDGGRYVCRVIAGTDSAERELRLRR